MELIHRLLEQGCGGLEASCLQEMPLKVCLGGGHWKASDVTWELSLQLLWGAQKMGLFEDEKASPEGLVGEVTVL